MTKKTVRIPGRASVEEVHVATIKELQKTLDAVLGTQGRGYQLSETPIETVPRVSTGSMWADWVTGGGVPYGRITEFYGPEHGGKTTLGLSTLAQIQQAGHDVAYIDAEYTFDPTWATTLGINPHTLFVLQPDNGEQALKALEVYVTSGRVRGVVIDSVSALVPIAELLETNIEKASIGRQAMMMSKGLRRLIGIIGRSQCAVVFINQTREKIGVTFGSPETTSGGKALRFYASLRLDIRRGIAIKRADLIVGAETKFRCKKNRGGAQMRSGTGALIFGHGFHPEYELVEAATALNILEKNGAHYKYGEERIGQGRWAAAKWLQANDEERQTITDAVLDVWSESVAFTL